MGKKFDLSGRRFGRLIAIERVGNNRRNRPVWKCKCDCGEFKNASSENLLRGTCTSCGCYQIEVNKTKGKTHGLSKTKLYSTWFGIISRCTNEHDSAYANYGGRGITVCKEWLDFLNFKKDIGDKPTNYHSLDRIDNNKGYNPENVRWAIREVQNRNQRLRKDNKFGVRGVRQLSCGNYFVQISVDGKKKSLGSFKTLEEAKKARLEAEEKYWTPT